MHNNRMVRVRSYSCVVLLCYFSFATPALSEDLSSQELFYSCPVKNVVRVASAESSGHFQSLRACQNLLVSGIPAPAAERAPVARIIGVPQEREKVPQRTGPAKVNSLTEGSKYKYADRPFDTEIRKVATRYRIDPIFLHAVVATESAYRPQAVSHAGALGLMQIMPGTGAMLGANRVALLDPARNLDAGARHLKQLQSRYGLDFPLILGAYNAGETAVARYGNRVPPYPETMDYVTKVMGRYGQWRIAGAGVTP